MKQQTIYVLLILMLETFILYLVAGTWLPALFLAALVSASFLHNYFVKEYKPMFGIIISLVTLFLVFALPNHNDFRYLWCAVSLHLWYLNYSLGVDRKREPLMKTLIIISGFIPCWYAFNAVGFFSHIQVMFLYLGSFAVFVLCWLSLQADFNSSVKPAKLLMFKLMLFLSFTLLLSFTAGRMVYNKPVRKFFKRLQNSFNFDKDLNLGRKPPRRTRLTDDFNLNANANQNRSSVNAFIQQKSDSEQPRLRLPIYLRKSGFSEFTGNKWIPTKVARDNWFFDEDDGSNDGWTIVSKIKTNISTDYVVYLSEPNSSFTFCLPGTVAVGLPKIFRGSDQTYKMERRRKRNMIAYAAHSYLLKYADIQYKDLEAGVVGGKYLKLPDKPLMDRLKKDTDRLTGGTVGTMKKIRTIKDYMSNKFTYEMKLSNPKQNMLEDFLYGAKRGNCTLFATAFALYLRAAGIPARVGTGYCSSTYDAQNDVYVFYNDDAHAWTEVCLKEYGWVIIDATPSSGYVAKGNRAHDFADNKDDFNFISGSDALASRFSAGNFARDISFKKTGYYFLILVIFGLIVSFVYVMAKNFSRFRKPYLKNGFTGKRERELTFFAVFCSYFAGKGCRRKRGETAMEYFFRLKNVNLIGSEFDDMLPYYYAVKYENTAPSLEFEKTLVSKIKQMKREGD
jgi:transglutaminase-like putative cysteine protease